jgi:adenylate cyclase
MLSGQKREVTALFCDLRGFTAFTERLPAEDVVAVLNDHFDLLVGIIAQHGGFVVDFLGDAVFAVFGALRPDADHAQRAVACAIEVQRARTARNLANRARGWPSMEMGAAISTGPAIVGNMGSLRRIKYGVVGSVVNVAARIETLTVGGQVLVADSTRQAVGDQLVVDGPLEAEEKGVDGLMRFWEVLALRGEQLRVLPSPLPDLAPLATPIEARVRLILGKRIDRQSYPAQVYQLGPNGAEFESPAPLEAFSALRLSMPALTSDQCAETVDAKVMAIDEGPGARRAVVRFTTVDWSTAAPIETEAHAAIANAR